jgi:hypothetical protein
LSIRKYQTDLPWRVICRWRWGVGGVARFHYKIISSSKIILFFKSVIGMTMIACPDRCSLISGKPSFFAALIARWISACVIAAGRRDNAYPPMGLPNLHL